MALMIRESYVNATRGYRFGDTDWNEAYTDDRGQLFRDLRKEYGRASKMYRDGADGKAIHVGWVFTKRMKYEDARGNDRERDYYTREVWVEVREVKDAD